MGLEILVWIWVLTWMTKTAATDVIYSLQGQVPPRKRERLARAERGDAVQRYGLGGWFADLQEDALRAHTEKRRAAAKAKGQPLDDLAEAVREKPQVRTAPERKEDLGPIEPLPPDERCGRAECGGWIIDYRPDGDKLCGRCGWASERRGRRTTPTDPNGVASCVKCGGTAVVDGVPCADCLAVQQERNAEWAQRVQGLGRDDRAVVAFDPNRYCGNCGEEFTPEQRQLGASDLLCRECLFRTPQGQPWIAVSTKPTTTNVVPLFPNTKEINMANIEATGLPTAIAFAEAAAAAHTSYTAAGVERYVGSLEQMGMSGDYISSAREAMEASTVASAKWEAHAELLKTQHAGREFYQSNPDAADKAALTNE